MATDYVPDREGIAALASSPEMSAAMLAIAAEGAAYGEQIAPRGDTGRYASSFAVAPAVVYVGRGNEPRAGAVIVNADPKAAAVEWRNGAHTMARVARFIDGKNHGTDAKAYKRARASFKRRQRAAAKKRARESQG